MKRQTIESIAKFAGASIHGSYQEPVFVNSISIDTRTIHDGDIYVPIIGENLDGHIFIEEAFQKGALACFCDEAHFPEFQYLTKPILVVKDTLEGFQQLAKNYRASLETMIIGITGSNGKTTTKDVINSVLKQKFKTKKTIGNLNNGIGVPRTLLELDEDTDIGIIEMGMDRFGEISKLADLAHPQIAAITNIGHSHLDQLKTKENVAKAKLEILEQMTEKDLFLYNYDDPVLRSEVEKLDIRPETITFGKDEGADYVLSLKRSDAGGNRFSLNGKNWSLNLIGPFQMYNAAVAIIIGDRLGLTDQQIQAGLTVKDQTAMRTQLISCQGFDILNDTYKSNPQSLKEALETTSLLAGYRQKIAILGDMLELGEDSIDLHREAGRLIDPEIFDYVLFYGELSQRMMEGALEKFPPNRLFHFLSKPNLVDKAKYLISKNSLVLVKASRSMRLEEIIESIQTITAI